MNDSKAIAFVLISSVFFISNNYLYAAERIFYEDCEDTNFSEYFLERHYGSHYQSYWHELTTELTRSSIAPHSGLYSMTYDPFTAGNPHAVVGAGDVPYGNTSNFRLRDYSGRYWYFRWYQRWEENIDWGGYLVKLLYINYQDTPDFTYFIVKNGNGNNLSTLKDYNTYSLVSNHYVSAPTTDDMQWHKLELLLDIGTTGDSNGSILFKIDDTIVYSESNIRYNSTISNNPIGHITGWPSNLSGSGGSGTGRTWLDDLEIYILDNCSDIPPVFIATRADVDQSSAINSTDAMLTLRNSLGLDMSQTNWFTSTTTGDVNCDGTTNSTDAMLILRHSLGLNMSGTGWCEN